MINFTQIMGTVQSCHLGYALGEAFEGQGYMREGLELSLEYVFSELKLHASPATYPGMIEAVCC